MSDRTLTEADITVMRELVHEAVTAHRCRFSEVGDDEFRDTWPTIKGMANATKKVQTITFQVVVTAFILFVVGLITRGVYQWIIEIPGKIASGGK